MHLQYIDFTVTLYSNQNTNTYAGRGTVTPSGIWIGAPIDVAECNACFHFSYMI